MLLLTGNKKPVHGRKLCSLFTGNVQYTKIEKPALKNSVASSVSHMYTVQRNSQKHF